MWQKGLLLFFILALPLYAQEPRQPRAPRKSPEQRLIEGAMANDIETVKRMIIGAKLSPDATYGYSPTPLQIAVSNNNLEMIEFLVRRKADINLVNNRTTALHIAADLRNIEVIAYLLRRRANPSIANSQGVTPLRLAAEKEDLQVMQALMVPANLREISANALMLAVARNQLDRVQAQLQSGLYTYNVDINGYTPLHYAAVLSTAEILNLVIPYYDINAKTHNNYSALTLAAKNNRADLIPLLLNARAAISEKDNKGNTPLHQAVINGAAEAVRTLVTLNAPTREVNAEGLIPLDLAKDKPAIKAMLQASYDLPVAVEKGNTAMVQRLLRQGAYVNIAHNEGNRPLHIAVDRGHLETARALIAAKASINVTNDYGNAPIHIAAASGNMEMLDLLVKSRAKINERNRSLELPIQLAVGKGHRDAVILLKNLGSELYDGVDLFLQQTAPPVPQPLNTSPNLTNIQRAQATNRLAEQRQTELNQRLNAPVRRAPVRTNQ